jgi:short-subunit dehydrogenase
MLGESENQFSLTRAAYTTAARQKANPYRLNCVGVGFFAPLAEPDSRAWKEICDTTLLGLMHMLMLLRNELEQCGTFVHVGSLAALRPSRIAGNGLYGALPATGD